MKTGTKKPVIDNMVEKMWHSSGPRLAHYTTIKNVPETILGNVEMCLLWFIIE